METHLVSMTCSRVLVNGALMEQKLPAYDIDAASHLAARVISIRESVADPTRSVKGSSLMSASVNGALVPLNVTFQVLSLR